MLTSNKSNKLVINNPNLSSMLMGSTVILWHLILVFFMGVNVITESLILKDSKLNCIRDSGEVICSLTGSNFFTNIEQVFSSKKDELIKVNAQDNVLVLTTENKKILLYTQTEIAERQAFELNSFLGNQNPLQTTVYIQTKKLSGYSNLLSSIAMTLFCGFIAIHAYIGIIRNICRRKIYVFDKEAQELTIWTSLKKYFIQNFNSKYQTNSLRKTR